jgi:phosphoribosylaminoimidazolecarboxamide formyltransferase/IMP cyclohydrolase
MENIKKPKGALISVFHKDGLEPIIEQLSQLGVKIYSTGGTEQFIKELGYDVIAVENITNYPSVFGGRVKTLHPKVFGGILHRRDNESDLQEKEKFDIPEIDLVIVDLYPFEKTVASKAAEKDIIEKIDIGGISLIRAAAKNFKDTLIVSEMSQYSMVLDLLNNGGSTLEDRKKFASMAFDVSSNYDTAIFNYFNSDGEIKSLKQSMRESKVLRYGENPHQEGLFYGDLDALFDKLNGKELSYNNLLDVDAAVNLMAEFKNEGPTFAILKHNNACGLASRSSMKQAYIDALAGDPISAFGGILIANGPIDVETAKEIDSLFCEVVIAPAYEDGVLEILSKKKNRIILVQKDTDLGNKQVRTILNGVLEQDKDMITDSADKLENVTNAVASDQEIENLLFASKICKHTKSNTIVLVKNKQLLASGTGQTSRIDALNQAIHKAKNFGFDLDGASMASDAFFPFPDAVETADKAGIKSVIQPGGSIKDKLSIDYCNENGMSMVFTGTRHFKH